MITYYLNIHHSKVQLRVSKKSNTRNFSCLFPSSHDSLQLVSLFSKSLNKTIKYFIWGRWLNLTLRLPYYMSFRSSLQSHPLWQKNNIKLLSSCNLILSYRKWGKDAYARWTRTLHWLRYWTLWISKRRKVEIVELHRLG